MLKQIYNEMILDWMTNGWMSIFRFAFKSGFNLRAKVSAYNNEK